MPTTSEPTHATIATFRMDMSREDDSGVGYASSSFLGSVSTPASWSAIGCSTRRRRRASFVVTFSSRHAAEAFQKNVESNAANQAAAIELVKIRVLEVTTSA
jgi:hypothetical protein